MLFAFNRTVSAGYDSFLSIWMLNIDMISGFRNDTTQIFGCNPVLGTMTLTQTKYINFVEECFLAGWSLNCTSSSTVIYGFCSPGQICFYITSDAYCKLISRNWGLLLFSFCNEGKFEFFFILGVVGIFPWFRFVPSVSHTCHAWSLGCLNCSVHFLLSTQN